MRNPPKPQWMYRGHEPRRYRDGRWQRDPKAVWQYLEDCRRHDTEPSEGILRFLMENSP